MNIWHDVDSDRVTPESFIAVVEISKGGQAKYELDKETGRLILDRVLYTSTHYPQNYGFIPKTYAGDNDPLDVLILCSLPIIPLTIVRCRPIGAIKMVDSGEADEKIIAICENDPTFAEYHSIDDLPQHIFQEIRHFFQVYKTLEGKQTVVHQIQDRDYALKLITESIENYKDHFENK
ncbi:MAG: inorganic diphosphatase [Bacilli bacterium]|jgi:inorganic pyrophosphatase